MTTTHIPEFPSDRDLTLAEIQSLADTLRRKSDMHVYTKEAFRRDRTIGWMILVAIVSFMGWITWSSLSAQAHFEHQVAVACHDRNEQTQALHDLYLSLTASAKKALAEADPKGPLADPKVRAANLTNMALLDNAAKTLKPLDCHFR